MTKLNEIYRCGICGNVVSVVGEGGGELVCCGQPMELLEERTDDEGQEKHVPVVEKSEGGLKVSVGSVQHPMEEKHHIQWIEILADGKACRKFLKPGNAPEALFKAESKDAQARALCNLHGLWRSP